MVSKPNSKGLQPRSDGLQPTSESVRSKFNPVRVRFDVPQLPCLVRRSRGSSCGGGGSSSRRCPWTSNPTWSKAAAQMHGCPWMQCPWWSKLWSGPRGRQRKTSWVLTERLMNTKAMQNAVQCIKCKDMQSKQIVLWRHVLSGFQGKRRFVDDRKL